MELSRKNKGILIGFILVLYGGIAILVYGKFFSSEVTTDVSNNFGLSFNPKPIDSASEFTIKNNHRDPFLNVPKGTNPESVANGSNNRNNRLSEGRSDLIFPKIHYLGSIEDANGKNVAYAISINGNQYVMKLKEIQQQVKLVRANKRFIEVNFDGVINKILLQK